MSLEPLTVTAYLSGPPVLSAPLLLDGILYGMLGRELYLEQGWCDDEALRAVADDRMPLARVETAHGWWWAASAVPPWGPEASVYLHRRPPTEMYLRLTDKRSVGIQGPDKPLRIPKYYRPAMRELRWTCVGDRDRIVQLLGHSTAIGDDRAHGHGHVTRWDVSRGGPPLEDYARDLRLRHLPVEAADPSPEVGRWVTRRRVPLRPPYWDRAAGVTCWQIPSVQETPCNP